jgi:hypothetical protein
MKITHTHRYCSSFLTAAFFRSNLWVTRSGGLRKFVFEEQQYTLHGTIPHKAKFLFSFCIRPFKKNLDAGTGILFSGLYRTRRTRELTNTGCFHFLTIPLTGNKLTYHV